MDWTGQSLDNKTLYLFCESAFEDIHYCVPCVIHLKNKYNVFIVIKAIDEYRPLFPSEMFTDVIDFDYQLPLERLPFLLDKNWGDKKLSVELEKQGIRFGLEKRFDLAIASFKESLEKHDNLGSHVNLAYAYFLNRNWKDGWEEYEYRLKYWHQTGFPSGVFYDIYKPEKNWDGKSSLVDKRVVVYCEQGIGDMIQFVRFVPGLTTLGAKVIIDTTENLRELLGGFGEIRTIYNSDYDYHCSVLSLPYLLGIDICKMD